MALPQRKIIHIDMDAFFASVEQRDNPELRGLPVAVGGSGSRGVVAAASYEAREFGIHSAMSSVMAKKKCPELIFVKPRFDAYKAASIDIHSVFTQFTDLIEPLSLDEAYLDVTVNKLGIPTATEIAKEIKKRIKHKTGLTASAGVSINKFLAKIASDYQKPDGLFVITPRRAQSFINQLSVCKFYGVGKVTYQKMKALGIFKGEDLKKWSKEDLVHHFGKSGLYFHDVAHGIDSRPVQAHRVRKSIGAEQTFDENKISLQDLRLSLEVIAQEVTRRIYKTASQGRTITVKIKFANFTQITRSHSVAEPVKDYASIYSVSDQLLSQVFESGMEVRLLGITLSKLKASEGKSAQLTLKY